ncbi:3-isopropylmalate dehydratase small subunit [Kiritimatiella glycovorans]|uniref:3-isopropylmalate dehydratase small subunit n=1 Tax=Kiritimatiella glycovorans TaxID=1307763 RepID=A0A0G3EKK3_9BACT|nr:3-isopropylmalate dehydratase small subunit [Kiritimatiella glycovorans]AKJ64709.1 3-isopropylmalate dehydratase small subunit 1 [Kiritimatiella glycovorans]
MEPLTTFRGTMAGIDRANIDTDAIIPKEHLKSVSREGFDRALFAEWRYRDDGSPDPEFVLNRPENQNARILVAGSNFGCGSSREHAVWALQQYGLRAIVAPWQGAGEDRTPAFADIFRNNALNNGLLPIELPPEEAEEIFNRLKASPGIEGSVDLEAQVLTVHDAGGEATYRFAIEDTVRERLLRGEDLIDLTLRHEHAITEYESGHSE